MDINKNDYLMTNEFDISQNRIRRFSQTWKWGKSDNKAIIIMYNPRHPNPNPLFRSQSIEKCIKALLNHDVTINSIEVVNLFADCSNRSKDLNKAFRKFDQTNFKYIKKAVMDKNTNAIILAWGKDYVSSMSRNMDFVNLIVDCNKKLLCLGLYDNHQPMHPANRKAPTKLTQCEMIKCKGSNNGNIIIKKDIE